MSYNKTEQSIAEGAEAIKQALCDDINKSLNGAYLDKIFDSEQNSLPLVDYLSAAIPGNTIASGKKEIENIVEQIYFDMEEWQSLALLQQQPTAEGAEEILKKHMNGTTVQEYKEELFIEYNTVLAAMQEFATLHAQRIAYKMVSERNNTNYDMKPIEVTMDYAIKKLKKLIRVQRTCPQGHGKMKKTSFGPYWCLNCQKYYE